MKYLIQPRHGAPLALLLALGSGMAQADAERLEADLKTMLGGEGTLEIGDVSDELFGSTTSAEDLVLTALMESGSVLLAIWSKVTTSRPTKSCWKRWN